MRNDLSNCLGSTCGGRDNVVVDSTTTTPVLGGRTINRLLGGSSSVNSGHQAFLNAKCVIDDLGKGSQTVGGARGVGDLCSS